MLVEFVFAIVLFYAYFGAFAGVCVAKLLKQTINVKHTAIDGILGVLGFAVGFFAYIGIVGPVNGVGAGPAGIWGSILFPAAHQGLRFLVAQVRHS